MNYRRIGANSILLLSSIFFGIFICEFAGRLIGLGNPMLYKSDPLVGYRLRPNQRNKRFQNATVSTDFEGFRIDPSHKKDSASEILVFVGDSVTYGGSYIDDTELFSSLFCANRSESICLNSGINAWGTYNMGRFISNFPLYSKRNPTKFILVILPGDDQRNLTHIESLPYWTKPPRNPKAINEILNFILVKYLIPSLKNNSLLNEKDTSSENIIKNKTIQHSWNDLSDYLKNSIAEINILITPPMEWLINSEGNLSNIKLYDNYLAMISKNSKVTKACNLYYSIKEEFSKTDYVDSAHLSKSGHKKWAKHIDSCLDK